jgi:DNA-binding transcriptional MocR family regulator
LKENVVLAPGNVFSIAQTAREWMRFNVAQMADSRLLAAAIPELTKGMNSMSARASPPPKADWQLSTQLNG